LPVLLGLHKVSIDFISFLNNCQVGAGLLPFSQANVHAVEPFSSPLDYSNSHTVFAMVLSNRL